MKIIESQIVLCIYQHHHQCSISHSYIMINVTACGTMYVMTYTVLCIPLSPLFIIVVCGIMCFKNIFCTNTRLFFMLTVVLCFK